jgi:hypothetical protein
MLMSCALIRLVAKVPRQPKAANDRFDRADCPATAGAATADDDPHDGQVYSAGAG